VLQVMAMTRPLREYMKERGLKKWRKLFLTANGFGKPLPVHSFSNDATIEYRQERTAAQVAKHCNLTRREAETFTQCFTLKNLRGTCGLKVFVDTHSEIRMSEALGHATFDRNLLARYLPPNLLAFFQARWIRAFHAGLLSVVLHGSEHRLRAVGAKSEEHLTQLLSSMNLNPLKEMLGEELAALDEPNAPGRMVFNANIDTLRFVITTARQEPPRSGEEIFWHKLSTHVLGVIKAREGLDPEVDRLLLQAEAA